MKAKLGRKRVHVEDMNSIRDGHYAKKQLFCDSRLISWSHRRRLQVGLELARKFPGRRVLDYGSGDGAFLALLMSKPYAPSEAIGGELHRNVVEECEARLGNSTLHFVLIDDLHNSGSFDRIFCMEVLEHVVELQRILDYLERLLAPEGKLFISVPVETGLPLILKQTVRRIAGWRGLGDYPGQSSYTIGEYLAAIFAGSRQRIARPIATEENGVTFPDHKGFNWMVFRGILAQRFEIEEVVSSPMTWLSAHLASQVWFVLRKKPRA